jgi:hypothetical protein
VVILALVVALAAITIRFDSGAGPPATERD